MPDIDILLIQIDQAYDRKSWHGTNLRGAIRGLSEAEAAWRPARARHSIQEIVVHAAYWKYAVRRRLAGGKRGSFPLKGSNWFPRAGADAALWRDDLRLLEICHRDLRQVVAALDPRWLTDARSGQTSPLVLVTGIIAHDLYHAGQIQLIKRLRGPAPPG
jgi:uncharacterized damage-inducible protein DinB